MIVTVTFVIVTMIVVIAIVIVIIVSIVICNYFRDLTIAQISTFKSAPVPNCKFTPKQNNTDGTLTYQHFCKVKIASHRRVGEESAKNQKDLSAHRWLKCRSTTRSEDRRPIADKVPSVQSRNRHDNVNSMMKFIQIYY